ncbi:CubicO group peptidase, beta-lactamase class C family [Sediminibacillus halophilus]|uniref:CubicO group peptidase, beta-lactamase class C family n=1 Tax=Sediminibacillus halophilus TaxID=482461 RepID=A0A1G9NE87_9BACI|nr:CubicO group peptidase, beta-lactamase class C family [Sediminibacillus halophilus]
MGKQLASLVEQSTVPGMSLAIIEKYNLQSTECFGIIEAGTNQRVKPETLFSACSISKFVTAMLVMKLAGRGILDLDEDVNRKLVSWKVPESPLTKTNKVTLRKLLSHQAGIKDPEESFGPLNKAEGLPLMEDVLIGKTAYCPQPVHIKEKPGDIFHYSDAGYCIIQLLIEDITEKSFETIMKKELFEPLRMKNSTYTLTEKEKLSSGHNKVGRPVNEKYPEYPFPAAAGLWTTPTDLNFLLNEFLLAAVGKSSVVLSHSLAEEMSSPPRVRSLFWPWYVFGLGRGRKRDFFSRLGNWLSINACRLSFLGNGGGYHDECRPGCPPIERCNRPSIQATASSINKTALSVLLFIRLGMQS